MSLQGHTRFVLTSAIHGIAFTAASGCARTDSPAQSPTQRAAAAEQSLCKGVTDDGAVADILNGQSVESVAPLYVGSSGKSSITPAPGSCALRAPGSGCDRGVA
jgi:hypothetical protein